MVIVERDWFFESYWLHGNILVAREVNVCNVSDWFLRSTFGYYVIERNRISKASPKRQIVQTGLWGVNGNCTFQYRPLTGSIKPNLQHFQFPRFGVSLGIQISLCE
jgi:hypothetical protein